ncbi:MAG: hypothetical protein AB2L07_00290 [Thermoanaerobaculaceae bacterium]
MGSFDPAAHQPEAAWEADPQRAIGAFMLVEQAHRLAQVWSWGRSVPGVAERAAVVRKQLNRLHTQDGPALDFLFELDIAARLAHRGFSVVFREPDLVLDCGEAGPLALACKRPRSVDGVGQALRRARRQIEGAGMFGVIVTGLEAVFHRTGDPKRPVFFYRSNTREELVEEATRALDDTIQKTRRVIDQELAWPRVLGILFCGVITGFIDQPSASIFEWVWRPISKEPSSEFMAGLCEMLFGAPSKGTRVG